MDARGGYSNSQAATIQAQQSQQAQPGQAQTQQQSSQQQNSVNQQQNVNSQQQQQYSTSSSAAVATAAAPYAGCSGVANTNQSQHHHHHHHQSNQRYRDNESAINHILLMTVMNPVYPITCDIVNQICSTYGKVLRIVIFKKNGVQAMVEFDSIESAKRAKQMLHGCDIYSGCCTLRVEYAKPTRLNVYKNDTDSFDYTNPTLGSGADNNSGGGSGGASGGAGHHISNVRGGGSGSGPHHSNPNHHHHHPHHNAGYEQGADTFHHEGAFGVSRGPPQATYAVDPYMQHGDPYRQDTRQVMGGPHNNPSGLFSGPNGSGPLISSGPPPLGGGAHQGSVMMVYGLNHEKINCDKLFNLFCLYGNVVRVKFLRTKEGCAMVQMGEPTAVDRCVNALNSITFFGCEMQLSYSKQAFLNDVPQPFDLPDGSPSFSDFMGNRYNRFTNPEAASKNRTSPPAKVLHFFNAPHNCKEEDIIDLFKSCSNTPLAVRFFPPKSERHSSGLVQFKDIPDAVEALVTCNHIAMPNPGGKPHILKLCFSSLGPKF